MGWAFVAFLVGVLLGISDRLPKRYLTWAGRLTTAGLALLLFTLGARIGVDAIVLAGLRTLGYQAAVLATATVLGSVIVVWLIGLSGALGGWAEGQGRWGDGQSAIENRKSQIANWPLTILILGSVILGIGSGGLGLLPAAYIAALDPIADLSLGVILFCVGLEIGHNRQAWQELRRLGPRALLLPGGIVVGSLGGALLGGLLVNLPANESTAIGAGFGWYSLSGVLLAEIYNVPTGALAFLTNVLRELIAVVAMPLLFPRFGPAVAIAPGGATTMDTTLPIVARSMGPEAALLAFASGAILTALVPVLVPLLIRL